MAINLASKRLRQENHEFDQLGPHNKTPSYRKKIPRWSHININQTWVRVEARITQKQKHIFAENL